MRTKKGFTILELLVVVAIISILAVITLPSFIGKIDKAKVSRELAEINAVGKAVATYYADKGVYPTLQGKDGALLQSQPIEGAPHNIDFSDLVPDYLATLPHFSYWWVDYRGEVYHTQKHLGTLTGGVFTPTAGYSYTLYKTNGSTQVLSAPYTLLAGEYVIGKDANGVITPKIGTAYKNEKAHPESGEIAVVSAPSTNHIDPTKYKLIGSASHLGNNVFFTTYFQSGGVLFEPITSGKSYIEVVNYDGSLQAIPGVTPSDTYGDYNITGAVSLYHDGSVYAGSSVVGSIPSFTFKTQSARMGILLDMDAKEVTFYTAVGNYKRSLPANSTSYRFRLSSGSSSLAQKLKVYTESADFVLNPSY